MENALTGSLSLVPSYVYWHYSKAAKHLWRLAADLSWFLWHFFSIGLLTRTFLKPWWREGERAPLSASVFLSGEALENFFATKVLNSIVMIFGIVVRGVVILVGLVAEAVLWIITVAFFLVWLVAPILVAYLIFAGIVFILRPL